MKTDEWVATALADDDVLVELLLRMKHSAAAAAAPTLAWGIRQPRSKSASAAVRKERDSTTRCSPTTPLSLSSGGGAASPSYDSCRPSDLSSGIRSKVCVRFSRFICDFVFLLIDWCFLAHLFFPSNIFWPIYCCFGDKIADEAYSVIFDVAVLIVLLFFG